MPFTPTSGTIENSLYNSSNFTNSNFTDSASPNHESGDELAVAIIVVIGASVAAFFALAFHFCLARGHRLGRTCSDIRHMHQHPYVTRIVGTCFKKKARARSNTVDVACNNSDSVSDSFMSDNQMSIPSNIPSDETQKQTLIANATSEEQHAGPLSNDVTESDNSCIETLTTGPSNNFSNVGINNHCEKEKDVSSSSTDLRLDTVDSLSQESPNKML